MISPLQLLATITPTASYASFIWDNIAVAPLVSSVPLHDYVLILRILVIQFFWALNLGPLIQPDDFNLEVGQNFPLNPDFLFFRQREALLPLVTPEYARRYLAH